MPYVERILILKNGPPWGFRLQEAGYSGLFVSRIRKSSPADMAGLQTNDQVLGLNGVSCEYMTHSDAIDIVETVFGTLSIKIGREEIEPKRSKSHKPIQTFFIEKPVGIPVEDRIASMPTWDPEPPEPLVQPADPEVTPVPLSKLLQEYEIMPVDSASRRRTYGDSSFWHKQGEYYPTIEEQIEMARQMALSITADVNRGSKGSTLFMKRKHRADKSIIEGPDPTVEMENWMILDPENPPVPPPPKPSGYPSLIPGEHAIPPPPPLPPGAPKTTQEFLERIKKYPLNDHSNVEPEKCFHIASALHSSNSLGSKIFNRRRAKSHKWTVEGPDPLEDESLKSKTQLYESIPVQTRPKLVSKLSGSRSTQQSQTNGFHTMMPSTAQSSNTPSYIKSPSLAETPLETSRKESVASSIGGIQGWNPTAFLNSIQPFSSTSLNLLTPEVSRPTSPGSQATGTREWRPVRFKIQSSS